MSQFLVLFLILSDVFFLLATANEPPHTMVEPMQPSATAEPPTIPKLKNHHRKAVKSSIVAPSLSPSIAPQAEDLHSTKAIINASDQQTEIVQVQIKKRRHSTDKSVAGGGVILGGLATTFMVAIFCYIRATGKKNDADTNGV
ncbi:hypothetical protein HYC85_006567 [Camellia sinensis]|uniref:Transmembrane protein n=1 Tax=Camellia sinensis TaxID=4442 RepID=A0A7J7HNB0_CAMSI|nr:hypothetical protein HYC85_006567 [Camellia sinensis]